MERSFNLKTVNSLLLFLLLVSIFIPIRKVFSTDIAYSTGAYSDFTSYSFYLSDLLVLILAFFNYRSIYNAPKKLLTLAVICILVLSLSIFSQHSQFNWLGWYFLVRLVEIFLLYYIVSTAEFNHKLLVRAFIALCSIEALIAIFQFSGQQSLGLAFFKESVIDPNIPGVAKIVSHGTKFIRPYGTLPHPNLLSVILGTGALFSAYQIFTGITKRARLIFFGSFILISGALLLTFSRAGIVAYLFGMTIFCWLLITKAHAIRQRVVIFAILILAMLGTVGLIIKPLIYTRATITDQATAERTFYNSIGQRIILHNPLLGVGYGTSVLHMQQFSPKTLEYWEIQPVHNYYLLLAAEAGIVMLIVFVLFLLFHVRKLWQGIRHYTNMYNITLFSLLLMFMFLMLFDHYFYTIESTRVLLWLILGLVANEIKKPTEAPA